MSKVEIRPQSPRTWGIYVNGKLVEGGFFSKGAAEDAAREYSEPQGEYRAAGMI